MALTSVQKLVLSFYTFNRQWLMLALLTTAARVQQYAIVLGLSSQVLQTES